MCERSERTHNFDYVIEKRDGLRLFDFSKEDKICRGIAFRIRFALP